MLNKKAFVIPVVIGLLTFGAGALTGSTFGTATVSGAATNGVPSRAVTASAPNLVVNGNFSRPVQPKNSYETVYPSAQKIPGWTVGGDSVDLMGSTYFKLPSASSSGSQAVDLSGSAPGSLTQTISTTPGTSYTLTWYEAGNPNGGQAVKVMTVSWDKTSKAYPAPSTRDRSDTNMGWSQKSQIVVASSAQSVLVLADTTPDKSPYGPVITDVSLTAEQSSSPPPSSGGSLLTGTSAAFGPCTTGDTYIDLTTGEVYSCSSAKWTDTDKSLKGPAPYDCSAAPYPGIDLAGCDLTNARLAGDTLVGADLTCATLEPADLDRADLDGADLTNAHLVNASLRRATLIAADLTGADLSGADLTNGTDLNHANLAGANLRGATLIAADLTGADLSGADLSTADLNGANLRYVNLFYANLRKADLTGATLIAADLTGADLSGADLTNASLHSDTLTSVTWHNTTCPDRTNSNNDGGTCANNL
jgi:choice-of-anchor C domain-containing protein